MSRRSDLGEEAVKVADGGGGSLAGVGGEEGGSSEIRPADLELADSFPVSDGDDGGEGERLQRPGGGGQAGASGRAKRPRCDRVARRSRSVQTSPSAKRRRSRRGMDHIMNYACQACTNNEERQSLEAAADASSGQQWMHSYPHGSMPQSVQPQFGMPQQHHPHHMPEHEPPLQQFTEGQHGVGGFSTRKKPGKVKLQNFNAAEDVNLTKWWLAISTGPVVNIGQRKEGFWSRVSQGYNSRRGPHPERSQKSLMSRWDHIKEQCNKFAGYYAQVLRENPSGMSDDDKCTEAQGRFAELEPKGFLLMHCWRYLKDEPKWMEVTAANSKAIEVQDDNYGTAAGSNHIKLDGAEASTPSTGRGKRPIGRDTAKQRNKKSASPVTSSVSSEYASKMHDLFIDRFSFMRENQIEKNTRLVELARLEKEKIDRHMDLEERRLALEARRLAKEERVEESKILADEERILSIDLDTCKPSLRLFYKVQQDRIMAKYSAPPS